MTPDEPKNLNARDCADVVAGIATMTGFLMANQPQLAANAIFQMVDVIVGRYKFENVVRAFDEE